MALFQQIMARLGLDSSAFDAGMDASAKKVEHFGKHVGDHLGKAFGAGAVAYGIESLIHGAIESGAEIRKFQERLDVSAASAQNFALASKLAGTDTEYFAGKYERLTVAINKASQGDEKAISAFRRLGISLEDINNLGVEEVLEKVFAKIQEGGLTTGESAAMMDIFAKGWGKLKTVAQEMEQARLVPKMTEDDLRNLKALEDFMTKTKTQAQVAAGSVVSDPSQLWWGRQVFDVLKLAMTPADETIKKWRKKNADQKYDEELEADMRYFEQDEERKNSARAKEESEQRTAWQKTMDRVTAIDKATAKLNEQTRVKSLSPEERHNELLAERAKIMQEIAALNQQGQDNPELLAERENRLAQLNNELATEKTRKISRIPVDALTKIGSAPSIHPEISAALQAGSDQKKHIQKMAHHLENIDRAVNPMH